VTGDLQIIRFTNKTFGSTGFPGIWLPPGYAAAANASHRYPVLYMLDGQILFDDCRGGVPEWHVDETLTRLIEAGTVRPLIVVGIDPGQRNREFLPYKDTVFAPSSREPARTEFPNFLANEVVPFIAATYRIEKGPQGVGGASYGAIAALYPCSPDPISSISDYSRARLSLSATVNCCATPSISFKGPYRVYLGMGGMKSRASPDSPEIQPEGKHMPATGAARFERAIEFLHPPPLPQKARQQPASGPLPMRR
jgi:hypothetical protein